MRLGILGGSFNPIHFGHLLLAEWCREAARLDRVWFLPAATPPHKRDAVQPPGEVRAAMVTAAIAGNPAFELSRLELDRGGVSYTVETLREIAQRMPDAELFLLMGADMLHDLPTWREPAEICRLATPLVVRRHGSPPPDFGVLADVISADRSAELVRQQIEMPVVEISSTEIRRRVSAGESILYQTPDAVRDLIAARGLYR